MKTAFTSSCNFLFLQRYDLLFTVVVSVQLHMWVDRLQTTYARDLKFEIQLDKETAQIFCDVWYEVKQNFK
jgi:uncharacterized membrane protein YoaT (DUF817 family)